MQAAFAATAVLAVALPAQAEDHYDRWKTSAPVAEFEQYLAAAKLGGVIPTQHLVRTASDWKRCAGPQFEVPPRHLWPEVRKVLGLVAELKKRNILGDVEAVSAYRNPKLNACAGGAKASSHTTAFAVDIVGAGLKDAKQLCSFWRTHGQAWNMGMSRYPSGRIHLDTNGYRTWGANHKSGSAFCS